MRRGLRAAADRLAAAMKQVAAVKTNETANAVNVIWPANAVEIRAGKPGGPYGWEPIQALMFEADLRHPLFGDKKYWFHQGYYPITRLTLKYGLDSAVDDFADEAVPALLDDLGL